MNRRIFLIRSSVFLLSYQISQIFGRTLFANKKKLDEKKFIRVLFFKGKTLPAELGIKERDLNSNSNSSSRKQAIFTIDEENPIVYKKVKYSGKIIIEKNKEKFFVINEIELEKYIAGVLRKEISYSWPKNAIKAQALAARSYAYNFIEKNNNKAYHVGVDTSYQVFGGIHGVHSNITENVEKTRDLIMVYRNNPIQTFFHASCGGITEKAEDVWQSDKKLRYFKNIRCPYCKTHPLYTWERSFKKELLESKIAAHISAKKIKKITILKMSYSKRIKLLALKPASGKSVLMTGNEFRRVLGAKSFPSTKFTLSKNKNDYVFKGKGFGHGVGLCQWGAKTLAERRNSYTSILNFYYKSCRITSIKKHAHLKAKNLKRKGSIL